MLNINRRKQIKLLPYILAGVFTYPIGRYFFFSDNADIKLSLALKNIDNGITHLPNSKIFIYKKDETLDIYDAHCTHMGCLINFNKQTKQFNCPCHKSRFDIDGKRLRGPAKRDLDKIAFKVKNKTLFVG